MLVYWRFIFFGLEKAVGFYGLTFLYRDFNIIGLFRLERYYNSYCFVFFLYSNYFWLFYLNVLFSLIVNCMIELEGFWGEKYFYVKLI